MRDQAAGVVLQTDGKIVIGGTSGSKFIAVRYGPDGALDTTFGIGGEASMWFAGHPLAHGMALQPDGKIIVVGTARDHSVFAAARFDTDGSADATFGNAGKVTTLLGKNSAQNAEARAVAVQADGKIVVVGWAYIDGGEDFAVVRYDANGILDSTFGVGGIAPDIFWWAWANAIAIQPDGKILVAGVNDSRDPQRFEVVRFQPDGTLDLSFGHRGKVGTWFGPDEGINLEEATAVGVQPDGKIIVAGYAHWPGTCVAMTRYLPDGTLDTTFGKEGRVQTPGVVAHYWSDVQLSTKSMAIGPDGRIALVAEATSGWPIFKWSWATVRYTRSGRLDQRFSGDGSVITDWRRSPLQQPAGIALQPDGNVVVAGTVASNNGDLGVLRYAPPAFRPDAKLRWAWTVGDDVYTTDEAKQALYANGWYKHPRVTVMLLLENDGTSPDRYVVKGGDSTRVFTVTYSVGDRSVTRAVVNGTYRTPQLAPGGTEVLKVRFVARPTAPLGATGKCIMHVWSAHLGTQQDDVRVDVDLTPQGP